MSKVYNISACVMSSMGKIRTNHEDNFLFFNNKLINLETQKKISSRNIFYIEEYDKRNINQVIFAVSDGMGGHKAGEVASFIAIDMLSKSQSSILTYDNQASINAFQQCVNEINNEILKQGIINPLMRNMGTTLSSVVVNNNSIMVYNLGDSRVYRYDGISMYQITKDHTEGQRLFDLNLLTEEELHNFASRKALYRYLGINTRGSVLNADVEVINDLKKREWFLICSDGISDVLDNYKIENILSRYFNEENVQEAVKTLIYNAECGNEAIKGGIDNMTAMIVEIKSN